MPSAVNVLGSNCILPASYIFDLFNSLNKSAHNRYISGRQLITVVRHFEEEEKKLKNP